MRWTGSRTQHSNCYVATLGRLSTTGHVQSRMHPPRRQLVCQSAEVMLCKRAKLDKIATFSLCGDLHLQ